MAESSPGGDIRADGSSRTYPQAKIGPRLAIGDVSFTSNGRAQYEHAAVM